MGLWGPFCDLRRSTPGSRGTTGRRCPKAERSPKPEVQSPNSPMVACPKRLDIGRSRTCLTRGGSSRPVAGSGFRWGGARRLISASYSAASAFLSSFCARVQQLPANGQFIRVIRELVQQLLVILVGFLRVVLGEQLLAQREQQPDPLLRRGIKLECLAVRGDGGRRFALRGIEVRQLLGQHARCAWSSSSCSSRATSSASGLPATRLMFTRRRKDHSTSLLSRAASSW